MLDIKTLGEPILRQKVALVPVIDEKIKRLALEMLETMREGRGVGLAGPQVDFNGRIFVCQVPNDKPRVFINPEIISTSQETVVFEEGCLSVPRVYADVVRAAGVTVQAWDENGKAFTLEAGGYLCRVILHETDHLNGKLFIDYLSPKKKERLLKQYEKKKKQ